MNLAHPARVLGPAVVFALAAAWLNGDPGVAAGTAAAANEAALDGRTPDVVVVGNSKAGSDVDANALAAGLGAGHDAVTLLEPASSAPAWYAMLEGRVFGTGQEPDVVVIYGQLAALMRTDLSATERRAVLDELGGAPSPVLDARLLGDRSGFAARARLHASSAHDALLTGVRDLAVGLFLAPRGPDGVLASGEALARPALGRVLGADAKFLRAEAHGALPIVETAPATEAMKATVTDPGASLVPDLVALVRAHGATPIFVRAPLPPATQSTDVADPALERATVELMNRLGVSWVDLHGLDLPPDAFRDDWHLGATGRKVLTAALVRALVDADVLDGGVVTARPTLAPAAVTRGGSLPVVAAGKPVRDPTAPCGLSIAIPELAAVADDVLLHAGLGLTSPVVVADAQGPLAAHARRPTLGPTCSGAFAHLGPRLYVSPRTSPDDALTVTLSAAPVIEAGDRKLWLVYPGGSLDWRFDEPWTGGGSLRVEAHLLGGAPTGGVRVGGVDVPLTPVGRTLQVTVPLSGRTAPWTVSVHADGWLALDTVELGSAPPVRLAGAAPVLLSPFRGLQQVAAPTALTLPAAEPAGTLSRYVLPAVAPVADEAIRARAGTVCSPVQLLREGKVLAAGHLPRARLEDGKRRGYTHVPEGLLVSPPGEGWPAGPYDVRLDPQRVCGTGRWLYPHDQVTWKAKPAQALLLRLGADRLVGTAAAFVADGRTEVEVDVDLHTAEKTPRTSHTTLHVPTTGAPAPFCVDLPALPPAAGLELTLSVDDAWVLLPTLTLGESEHLACSGG